MAFNLFSHYQLLSLLGEGAYAKVWKCRDTRDGNEYAIKILHTHLASQENVRTRFLREADVQTKLYHPKIVKVLAVVEDQDSVGMVMELIEGKTLADAIALQKQMPFDQIQRIMEQILDAVGYAHSHQIVHRDLKPSNILMLGDGTVKVSDFGIARILHTQGAGVRTRTGMALGTSYYMSPEQVQGRKDLDHRSDIYALGCILYELLVGHPMFFEFEQQTDDPDFLIKSAHCTAPVPDPRNERADIPAGVIDLLNKVLEKKPEDRAHSCAKFSVMLQSVLALNKTELKEKDKSKSNLNFYISDPLEFFYISTGYRKDGDNEKANHFLFLAAESGHAESQFQIGRFYKAGDHWFQKSIDVAIKFFIAAAEKGHAGAMVNLGVAYEHGDGDLPVDPNKAVDYYLKAEDKNHAVAHFNLGVACEIGKGRLQKDIQKAIHHYKIAAELGDVDANKTLKYFE